MAKHSFTRSNVNESTLQVSQPQRSSFDLGSVVSGGFPLGKFIPVRCEHLLPSAVLLGSITPEQTLKEIGVPDIGPLRLDTHTVAVSKRRINKDWVKVVKGSLQQQPYFSSSIVFGDILRFLLSPLDSSSRAVKLNELLLDIFNDPSTSDKSNAGLVAAIFARAGNHYALMLRNSSDDSSYNLDFYHLENRRLAQLYSAYSTYQGILPVSEFSPFDAIYEVMKPFFGEGSIMDRLGYAILAKYGRACSWMRNRAHSVQFSGNTFVWTADLLKSFVPDAVTFPNVLAISKAPMIGAGSFVFADTKYFISSEWDIRATYAAWYDSLRNWHIEEASKLPNPDDWSTGTIFSLASSQGLVTSTVFGAWCCFLIPRYRNYQNDLFTTIQTDDVFRHIFAPIFDSVGSTVTQSGEVSDYSYDNVLSLTQSLDQALNVLFPFGFFNRSALAGTSGTADVYSADLQTMRRAGWLEKYCARNYYYPDTFEGKMQARYGISASDLLGVTSKYIEGGESFVTGQQTVNPTETSQMPAGSRTFQGGSAINGDTFTFAAGGDDVILVTFCSWMPLVTYSATNPHLSEISAADIVAPEFATDTRVQIQAMNLVRDLEHQESFIGYVPRYVNYRARLNEAHDEYLTDKRSFVWLRDWYSAQDIENGIIADYDLGSRSMFAINAYDMRVRLPLDGFLNLKPWDSISYGKVTFAYSIDLPLPAAVEFI